MCQENSPELAKMLAGSAAVGILFARKILHDGMKIGMGTGSTVKYAIESLGYLLDGGHLKDIAVVPTSQDTLEKCNIWGIPTFSFDSDRIGGHLDIAIDGADRIDENNNLIKGGGAALFREKVVAYNADLLVIVADGKKKVKSLNCDFPLPVEVLPFAYKTVALTLETRGLSYKLREDIRTGKPLITENNNYILDVTYPKDFSLDPRSEEIELNKIVGVVENGFFYHKNTRCYYAEEK